MYADPKSGAVLVGVVCIGVGLMTGSASAVTAEIAKRCDALAAKAFPPRVAGNPAAGSTKGTGQSMQSYFNKCVAKGGHVNRARTK
jgi:hypothetical protein